MARTVTRAEGRPGDTIPVAKPCLPTANAILPYLRRIDRAAWYSNGGPLLGEFQARLAALWGVGKEEVALLSSATSALTLSLLASDARPGTRCLMPSWTFAASAGAVVAAGLRPFFVDVCPRRWVPDPDAVQALAMAPDVGAILIVSPFGAPLDLAAWDAVQRATGVPVLIDAAASFDTLRKGGPMRPGRCSLAVSLHATKVFGVGEGGALICRDPAVMERVRRLAQFGFLGTRQSMLPGFNAKLSEYAAAVGLAGLDSWPETRMRWHVAAARYRRMLPEGIALSPSFGEGWVSSTLNVLVPGTPPVAPLHEGGVETLRWWGPGCHAQPAYAACGSTSLAVTEDLAVRTLGLPFWQGLQEREISLVCQALQESMVGAEQKVAA